MEQTSWYRRSITLGLPILLGLGLLWWGTEVLESYGLALFVALPAIVGFAAASLDALRAPRTLARCLAVAMVSLLGLGAGALVLAWEGLVCLLMAAPLAVVLAGVGGLLAFLLQRRRRGERRALGAVLVMPLLFGAEAAWRPEPPLVPIRTETVIDAPPEVVWTHVVSFSELPPPEGFWFRHGVAYPLRAEIVGEGVGAVRTCVFSTGAFVEPIEVWEPGRRLAFSVVESPPPMEEWNPFHETVHPPHLKGFLVSEKGEFVLEPLAGGRTLLVGRTWYRHGLWPAAYWSLWSQRIVHGIHTMVLEHIRDLAEADARVRG